MVLGKDNLLGHHCAHCDLTSKEWSGENHDAGNQWTVDALLEAAQQFVQQGPKKAVHGIIKPPHCLNIEPKF